MSDILVERKKREKGSAVFSVEVREGGSKSSHRVTVEDEDYERLAPEGASAEDLLEESFRFLLEREPKESILGSFELTVIGDYFPEYEAEIQDRLAEE